MIDFYFQEAGRAGAEQIRGKIRASRFYGIELCSFVETKGKKKNHASLKKLQTRSQCGNAPIPFFRQAPPRISGRRDVENLFAFGRVFTRSEIGCHTAGAAGCGNWASALSASGYCGVYATVQGDCRYVGNLRFGPFRGETAITMTLLWRSLWRSRFPFWEATRPSDYQSGGEPNEVCNVLKTD